MQTILHEEHFNTKTPSPSKDSTEASSTLAQPLSKSIYLRPLMHSRLPVINRCLSLKHEDGIQASLLPHERLPDYLECQANQRLAIHGVPTGSDLDIGGYSIELSRG